MNRFQQRAAQVPRPLAWLIASPLIAIATYWWVTYSGLYRLLAEWRARLVSALLPAVHRHLHDPHLSDPGGDRDPGRRRHAREGAQRRGRDRGSGCVCRAERAQQQLAAEPATAAHRRGRDGDVCRRGHATSPGSASSPALASPSTRARSSAATTRRGGGPRLTGRADRRRRRERLGARTRLERPGVHPARVAGVAARATGPRLSQDRRIVAAARRRRARVRPLRGNADVQRLYQASPSRRSRSAGIPRPTVTGSSTTARRRRRS